VFSAATMLKLNEFGAEQEAAAGAVCVSNEPVAAKHESLFLGKVVMVIESVCCEQQGRRCMLEHQPAGYCYSGHTH
jgi:hypothetical protein